MSWTNRGNLHGCTDKDGSYHETDGHYDNVLVAQIVPKMKGCSLYTSTSATCENKEIKNLDKGGSIQHALQNA